jgi:deazaflavin-dependent oxidoreductase (nitroreductase family)
MFGHALLVVTHVGRRTGRPHRTVLYVQRYDPRSREATVISVWGESQWLRNLRHAPATQIDIGLQRYRPEQRFLETDEIFELEKHFRTRHRLIAWARAKLMGWPWPATDDELRALSAQMRAVAFHPARGRPSGGALPGAQSAADQAFSCTTAPYRTSKSYPV